MYNFIFFKRFQIICINHVYHVNHVNLDIFMFVPGEGINLTRRKRLTCLYLSILLSILPF